MPIQDEVMLSSITLSNYKSFGTRQIVPLQPLTVLVGPNNSGKSNLMSVGRFFRNVAVEPWAVPALNAEGGPPVLLHRGSGSPVVEIGWGLDDDSRYTARLTLTAKGIESIREQTHAEGADRDDESQFFQGFSQAFGRNRGEGAWRLTRALGSSRSVRLSLRAIRAPAAVVQNAQLGSDGSNAAAVIGEWSAGDLARSEQLDAFLHRCVPEVLKVRAGPSATPGHQDLSFVHTRGQTFGPDAVSDGVLFFTALAMHLVDASPGIVLFIEEPETGIHPRRLRDVIDLMRQIVRERGCQIVMSTHSPVVLDVFRDEPEAIVLFRRDAGGGTETRVAAEAPRVVAALEDASPGELLETGYFDGAWD